MKTIIVGGGVVGTQLAKILIDEKRDVVIIEKDPENARHLSNQMDCLVIPGEGNNLEILRAAGIGKADHLVSVTSSDEINMVICGLAVNENQNLATVARIRNTDYHSFGFFENPLLGISYMVHPDLEVARTIIRTLEHGALGEIKAFEDSELKLINLEIRAGTVFANRTVADLRNACSFKFLIVTIIRKANYTIPRGDTLLLDGDIAYFIAPDEAIMELYRMAGKEKTDFNKIALVGGGRIGTYIVNDILEKGKGETSLFAKIASVFIKKTKKTIAIIDKDYEKCKNLTAQFPEVLVLNADVSEEGFAEEEDLPSYDLLLAVTDNQELNLITAAYARKLGVKKTVALVVQNSYVNIASHLGIDVTISLKDAVVNTILRYIRKGDIKNIYGIAGGKIDIIEMVLQDDCRLIGRRLEQVRMPKDSLVVTVTRKEKSFIPDGDYIFQPEDAILIIAPKDVLAKVEELFI